MWDTLINFWNMGIQSFLIFGDNCRIFFEGYGIFFEKINGIWDTGTPPPPPPPFQGLISCVRKIANCRFWKDANLIIMRSVFLQIKLTHKAPNTTIAEFANTVDPDETGHNEPSHLDLQCLPSSL